MRILIVGFGDVAARLAPLLVGRHKVYGLIRDRNKAAALRTLGVVPVIGNLDERTSLRRLAGLADCIVHLAPPPAKGSIDPRTRRLMAALSARQGAQSGGECSRKDTGAHCRVVYVSTSGVYGDCEGEWVTEARGLRPGNDRARRRVDAEHRLHRWQCAAPAARSVSVLRAPGIYAADRLPLARLRAGTPAVEADEDSFSNHIHADDLARAVWLTLFRGRKGRAYNCCDDEPLRMGDYFDQVADRFALPRPARISRSAAEKALPETLLSFMRESRRLDNRRLRRELRMAFAYPSVAVMLSGLSEESVSAALSARDDTRPR